MTKRAGLIACLGLLTACVTAGEDWAAPQGAGAAKGVMAPADTALIFNLVHQVIGTDLGAKEFLLVVQDTLPVMKHRSLSFPQDYAGIHRYLGEVPQACVTSFIKGNKQRSELDAAVATAPQQRTGHAARINQLLKSGGWQALQRRYQNTKYLVSVARPGVCAEHTQALMYVLKTSGDAAADGILMHAALVGSDWHIIKQVVITRADGLAD